MPSKFTYFAAAPDNKDVRKAYKIMQNQYVMRDSDRIPYEAAMSALAEIREKLQGNPAWVNYQN